MMLVVEPVQAAIWHCLDHYDYSDAIFLAERLRAEVDTDDTLFLLATCYYRAGKKMQAYSILRARKLISSKCKFLMAKCCVDLEKIPEAELVLTGGDVNRFQSVDDVTREFGDESAFVLQIIGRIYYKSERNSRGTDIMMKSLKIYPFLWQSFKELCDHGERPDPSRIFHASSVETPANISFFNPAGGYADNISTPVHHSSFYGYSQMSGIRQITPDQNFFRAPAASKPCKLRNLTESSPYTPSFGVCPLEYTPGDSYVLSSGGNGVESSDQKLLSKRQLHGRKEMAPLQVSKPINQMSNTVSNLTTPTPRRSTRIITPTLNSNVKENSKISKYTTSTSPTRKSKIRTTRNNKSNMSDLKEQTKNIENENAPMLHFNTFHQVAVLQKQSMDGLYNLLKSFGTAYLHLAQYELNEALECFQDLPASQRNTPLVLSYCGKAHSELYEYKDAIRYFEKVREIEPFRESMMEIYSTALWFLHKDKDLSRLAQDLLQYNRFCPSTWCAAGNCVSLHKEYDVAIKFFERAVQLDPEFAYAHTLLGHEYLVTEELDKAATCFRNAIRVDPRHYNAWYGLGSIYMKQEKYQLAEVHFKSALAIHPTSTVIMCNIGVVQKTLQRPAVAMKTFEDALKINPNCAVCKYHRASLLYSSGRYQEALEELEELQRLVPKESAVFYLTAKVHKKLGNDHLTSMYISWGTDLDPKGANIQVREASDLLVNNSLVPDLGRVLSPTEPPNDSNGSMIMADPHLVPSTGESILDPVDMDETL